MISLSENNLNFSFPEASRFAGCSVQFNRSLRIPDDMNLYPYPPGYEHFPLRLIDDYQTRVPAAWYERGGVVMPMYQAEALWLSFPSTRYGTVYPIALQISTGGVCALSGQEADSTITKEPQNYIVIPDQRSLDGYYMEGERVRQFVAMPLGEGFTAEEQLTEKAVVGGMKITAIPMKADFYRQLREAERKKELEEEALRSKEDLKINFSMGERVLRLGLAAGGSMKTKIIEDTHGLDAWDTEKSSSCFVTLVNSEQWYAITGESPPAQPPTAREYSELGLPWFDYYGNDRKWIRGRTRLSLLKGIAELLRLKGRSGDMDNSPVNVENLVTDESIPRIVREY